MVIPVFTTTDQQCCGSSQSLIPTTSAPIPSYIPLRRRYEKIPPQTNNAMNRMKIKINSIEYRCRAMCYISIGMYRAYDNVLHHEKYSISTILYHSHLIQLQPQFNNIKTMHQILFNPIKYRCRVMCYIYVEWISNFISCTSDRRNSCINSSSSIRFFAGYWS